MRGRRKRTNVERPDEEEDETTPVSLGKRSPQEGSNTVASDEDGDEQDADFLRDVEVPYDGRDQVGRGRRGECCAGREQ